MILRSIQPKTSVFTFVLLALCFSGQPPGIRNRPSLQPLYFYNMKTVIVQQCFQSVQSDLAFSGIIRAFTYGRRLGPNLLPPREDRRRTLLLLLLMSGIEPNPGPQPSSSPDREDCNLCFDPCKWGQDSVCCDSCHKWFHRGCLGYSVEKFQILCSSTDPWFCQICQKKQAELLAAFTRNSHGSESASPAHEEETASSSDELSDVPDWIHHNYTQGMASIFYFKYFIKLKVVHLTFM